MTWPLTEVPPTVTSSVPVLPLAPDPSAYWMLQLPSDSWKVSLWSGSKMLWPDWSLESRREEKTQLESR